MFFKWKIIIFNGDTGYIPEVNVTYLKQRHVPHSDLPFLPLKNENN